MSRSEPWMLAPEERIGRRIESPQPAGSKPTSARRPKVKRAAVALACMAVAVLVSGALLVSLASDPEPASPANPDIPGTTSDTPLPPYSVFGYTEDEGGSPLYECTVTITNLNTGEYVVVASDAVNGWYEYDIRNGLPSGCDTGDEILVEAEKDGLTGEGQGTVDLASIYPFLWLDITLTGEVIPEFPTVLVPVAGVLALFAIVGLKRRGEQ